MQDIFPVERFPDNSVDVGIMIRVVCCASIQQKYNTDCYEQNIELTPLKSTFPPLGK